MVAAIGRNLDIGPNAVYRRLKGDTSLSASEMLTLARLYHIDLNFSADKFSVDEVVYMPSIFTDISSEVDFFRELSKRMTFWASLTDTCIRVVTPELPLSYELAMPVLRAFKIYTYGNTTWGFKKWLDVPFTPALIHPEANAHAEAIVRASFSIPGIQLLSPTMMDITLSQIVYQFELGKITDTDLLDTLFKELHLIIGHIEDMAGKRLRYLPGDKIDDQLPKIEIYRNEIPTATNMMLIRSKERSLQVSMEIAPNYISTVNEKNIAKSVQWFGMLVQNSTLLGIGTDKQTRQFFQRLRSRVNNTHDQIKKRHFGGSILI